MTRHYRCAALTLWQPWASAITHCGKMVENRTWKPPAARLGRPLAIHAGKKIDQDAVDHIRLAGLPLPGTLPTGCVVAVGRLVGYVHAEPDFDGIMTLRSYAGTVDPQDAHRVLESDWFTGPYGWLLGDLRVLPEPVPAKGAQGLWTWETTVP